eukprot:3438737-Pyramimonas_sp.AAC.1
MQAEVLVVDPFYITGESGIMNFYTDGVLDSLDHCTAAVVDFSQVTPISPTQQPADTQSNTHPLWA